MDHDALIEKYLLASDSRFSHPEPFNDHVWEIRLNESEPKPISLFTTFGLQAKSMLVYPIFSNIDGALSPKNHFCKGLKVTFRSANFIELIFLTFQTIDVILKVWVPTSRVIVGQVNLVNNTNKTQTTEMDWRVQLDPITPGKKVSLEHMGINKVLCGQTGKLYPLFYLSGGPEESTSSIPGLSTRSVLTPGSNRQLTWALATDESPEASLQSARQFSSHHLDLEKLKMEMELEKRIVRIINSELGTHATFMDSQTQAHQLILPGINAFRTYTYLNERTPLTPPVDDIRFPQLSPAWSGQSLPTLHLLAQVLLPGYPSLLAQLITNEFDSQSQDGKIDVSVNAGNQPTGLLAPPMLCSLVERLIPYISDTGWFFDSYPKLEKFLWKWIRSGEFLRFTHPLQTGVFDEDPSGKTGEQLWLRLSTAKHPFFLSLLIKEIKALRSIARKANLTPADWVDEEEEKISKVILDLWDANAGIFTTQDLLSGESHRGSVLTQFFTAGNYPCSTRFHSPTSLYICIEHEGQLPVDLKLSVSGRQGGKPIKIDLTRQDFHTLGGRSISIIFTPFSSVSNLRVKNITGEFKGQLGVTDLTLIDITSLMPLWAGTVSPEQRERMTGDPGILPYLDENGLWLQPCQCSMDNLRAPDSLALFIIEGLLANEKQPLAMDAFQKHFLSDYAVRRRAHDQGRISSLVPVHLYLKLLGIRQISHDEVILQCFSITGSPVTVQYGQINITITSSKVILQVPGAEPLAITATEPQRILMERERRSLE